jgi:hypothetical protein
VHPRPTRVAPAAGGSQEWLLDNGRAIIGRAVHSATVLAVDGGPLGAAARHGELLVVAITDDEVYLLDYRARTVAPSVGAIVRHLPRSGVVVQWRRRLLDVKIELSWPDQHVFLSGGASPGSQTDRVLGQLMSSELEHC